MQKREKYVWLRFLLLVAAGCVLLPFVLVAMFIAWCFRMVSRLISFLMQKLAGCFYSVFEGCAEGLGFFEKKRKEEALPPTATPEMNELPEDAAGLQEDLRRMDEIASDT